MLPKDGLKRSDFDNPSFNKHKTGRFVVTAAPQGAKVIRPFLKTLESYCEKNKAKLIILPMDAHVKPNHPQPGFFDTEIEDRIDRGQIVSEYVFNDNLKAADFYLKPQQIKTLTGLERFNNTSLIVAHTKQFLKHHAVGNNGISRSIHSTGVCTEPDYQLNRIGALADLDHTVGALVIEIVGDTFHQRQLTADANYTVVDLGQRYFPDGKVKKARCTSLVLGDIHAGHHCHDALRMGKELASLLSPEHIVLHDLFNGASISHHVLRRKLDRLKVPAHVSTLEMEFQVTERMLHQIREWSQSKVCIAASNHNDWLMRYLQETDRWANDEPNAVLAAELFSKSGRAIKRSEKFDPLQHMVDPDGKCIWWDRETDYRVDGIQLACHGDLGTNGRYASNEDLEKAHGKATVGHTHTSEIHRGIYHVGHSTIPRHGYNQGASTWTKTHCVQFEGGQRQLITLIKSKYRA